MIHDDAAAEARCFGTHPTRLGASTFCAGGTIRDSHASTDPTLRHHRLIDATITCPGDTVKVGLTPDVGPSGPGKWTIVDGAGSFEGLRGSGKMTSWMIPTTNRSVVRH
jgi:hypothetical protein